MRHECDRTRLIAELASLLRDCELSTEARTAGLTLIGFLARRMPGEGSSTVGVVEVTALAALAAQTVESSQALAVETSISRRPAELSVEGGPEFVSRPVPGPSCFASEASSPRAKKPYAA